MPSGSLFCDVIVGRQAAPRGLKRRVRGIIHFFHSFITDHYLLLRCFGESFKIHVYSSVVADRAVNLNLYVNGY